MLVDHPALGGQIDQRRLNILNGIAHQTAMTLENARLQAEASAAERHGARTRSRARHPDQLPARHTAQRRRLGSGAPSTARRGRSAATFTTSSQLDEYHWALVVADVADKGVPAALFMALSRTLLRAVGSNRQSPAETLRASMTCCCAIPAPNLFVTVWYGLWDTRTGEIKYSSAGHNPAAADPRRWQRGTARARAGSRWAWCRKITVQEAEIVAQAGRSAGELHRRRDRSPPLR